MKTRICLLLLLGAVTASGFTLTLSNLRGVQTDFIVNFSEEVTSPDSGAGFIPVSVRAGETVTLSLEGYRGGFAVNTVHIMQAGDAGSGWVIGSAENPSAFVSCGGDFWSDDALTLQLVPPSSLEGGSTDYGAVFAAGFGLAAMVRVFRTGLRWTRRAAGDIGPGGES